MKYFLSLPLEARYIAIGIWNTIVGYSLFTILMVALRPSQYLLALTLSTGIAGVNSYFTQRRFVWQSKANISNEFAKFSTLFVGQFILNAFLLYILVERYLLHPLWTQYILGGIIIVSTYFINKHWTFRISQTH